MMNKECQNCKSQFVVEDEDLQFYEKMKVPAPTWCPECRMIRRMVFRNESNLFRKKDARTGKEIFSMYREDTPIKIYDRDFWFSDGWDPMDYGRDYDFSRPFFEQLRELVYEVPWLARFGFRHINSDYVSYATDAKNAYLCFFGIGIEDSAYVRGFRHVTNGFDLYQSRHSELCYDCYMVDEAQRVFFSVNIENCHDVWFSRNLIGCANCFGCMNLRNKKHHIFNKEVSKEDYKKFMDEFNSGSFKIVEEMRRKSEELWMKRPNRFTLAINTVNSTGEHIEHAKNVKESYFVHDAEDVKYSQMIENATDVYDTTVSVSEGKTSRVYEGCVVSLDVENIKFSLHGLNGSHDIEYSFNCIGSSNLFGCAGLNKKQYCIFNKQYSKEDYHKLRKKIIQHMDEMPYIDKQGRVYKYGEFFPPEFSPFAYNETIAQDFFPLTKEEAIEKGYRWRESEEKDFNITKKASELPDSINDVDNDILKEVIACDECSKAYRIIPMELAFYKRIPLPLPRLCVECRFQRRFKFVNPPKFWERKCQCAGVGDDSGVYKNDVEHFHGADHCPNEFRSSFAPEKPDIVYCEQCYKEETI